MLGTTGGELRAVGETEVEEERREVSSRFIM